jgi:hypothetical protein
LRRGVFFEVRMNKATEAIKLHLPERLKRDIQDAAMADDRKVSEWIRHVLALHLYGVKGIQPDSEEGFEGR